MQAHQEIAIPCSAFKAQTRLAEKGILVVKLTGRITLQEHSARFFRDLLGNLFAQGYKKLLLEMADVSYMDSTGIGQLVSGYTDVIKGGGQLKILGMSKRVRDMFQYTKLYTVFEIFEEETQAMASFL